MEIRIDCELLNEQIKICDEYSNNVNNEHDRDLFDGISNLLSEVCYALDNDKPINFVKYIKE